MREKYESMPLVKLRELAKSLGIRGISTMKKKDLIDRLVDQEEKEETKTILKNLSFIITQLLSAKQKNRKLSQHFYFY